MVSSSVLTFYNLAAFLVLGTSNALAASSAGDGAAVRRVLVAGAGGQTGSAAFRKLLSKPGYLPVGTVRNDASRQALLQSCDESTSSQPVPPESVVVCDITSEDSASQLESLLSDCDAALICTSAKPAPTGKFNPETNRPEFGFPNGQPESVDWHGQKRLIDAAAKAGGVHVVICSSMGGTNPENSLNKLGRVENDDGSTSGGDILKWKRKAEKYLADSGMPYTVIHPGGLLNEPGGQRELCVGVDDEIEGCSNNSVPREDVADIMIAAVEYSDQYQGRSFDLVSKPVGEGETTKDFKMLLDCLKGKNCDYSLGEIA